MEQAIVILLKENEEIEDVRRKYVPDYKKFKPHISLVFPFKDIIQKQLHKHIRVN